MAQYLTNKETQAALENIILNAKKTLVLISPYLRLTNTLRSRIKAAAEKGVKVTIVFRNKADVKADFDKLSLIQNIEFKCTDDLHAKCYFNETMMIITSLNLLDSSEKNWEMGVLIRAEEDKEMYNAAIRDCRTIYSDSSSTLINKQILKYTKNRTKIKDMGFCIRCNSSIPLDLNKPYCITCYSVWLLYGNEDFIENSCHACGELSPTIRLKPLCDACYYN